MKDTLQIVNDKPADVCPYLGTSNPNRERVAVLAFHGMGQQNCYETLDLVATSLCREACRNEHMGWRVAENPRARVSRVGEQRLGRVELLLSNGIAEREVHIYEAYWAPLTQGHICVSEILAFLFHSGLNGMRHWAAEKGRFTWRVFTNNRKEGRVQNQQVTWWAPLLIAVLIALLVGFLSLTALVLTIAATWVLHVAGAPDVLCHGIGATVTLLGLVALAVIAILLLSGSLALSPTLFSWLGDHYRQIGLILYAGGSVLMCWIGISDEKFLERRFDELRTWVGYILAAYGGIISVAASPFVIWIWTKVRYFLVQFIGDVAIYVSADRLNRFWMVREEIRALCCRITSAIYDEKDEAGRPAYDGVIVLGHSLGSVVGYHALNAALIGDAISEGAGQVAERTRLFLTFGSPLDKVTYLFRVQAHGIQHTDSDTRKEIRRDANLDLDSTFREAVDSAFAPLASCAETRKVISWVNVWAKADHISDSLKYFDAVDEQPGDPPRVDNRKETEASWNPINAHTGYWTQPQVSAAVFEAITAASPQRVRNAGAA
jgi:hypothetical protein